MLSAPPASPKELDALGLHCAEREDQADKGTWARLRRSPVEGRLEGKLPKLNVGDKVLVRLTLADPRLGYIDFEAVKKL